MPAGVVLDGELIVWERDRTNFALLQRRVTAGARVLRMAREYPAHYVVFDLLRDHDGTLLLDVPLSQRRAGWPPCSPMHRSSCRCAHRPATWTTPASG
jgi:ATP-dependent DNA ligase